MNFPWPYGHIDLPTSPRPATIHFTSYDSEVVVLVKLNVPSHHVTYYDSKTNAILLVESLDLLDEKSKWADLRATTHRSRVVRLYNAKV